MMSPQILTLEIQDPENKDLLIFFSNYCSDFRLQKMKLLHQPADQLRSVAVGFLLNQLLTKTLNKPSELILEESADKFGRPLVKVHPEIHISITHAGDQKTSVVACALHNNPVGIDIEQISTLKKIPKESFYHQCELNFEFQMKDYEILPAQIWTQKEAYLKALGIGFQKDPKEIDLNQLNEWNFKKEQLHHDYFLSYCWKKENLK